MIVWMEMSLRTVIDYHAPFDQGFTLGGQVEKYIAYKPDSGML